MKSKSEILYTNFINFLDEITENAEEFSEENNFNELISKFDDLKDKLSEKKENNESIEISDENIEKASVFETNYSNYTHWNKNKFVIYCKLINKIHKIINEISQETVFDLAEQINEGIFTLRKVEDTEKINIYNNEFNNSYYLENTSIENAILLADFSNIDDLLNIFDNSNFEILFHLLNEIDVTFKLEANQYILIKKNTSENKKLLPFIKIKLLAKGKQIHQTLEDIRTPEIIDFNNQNKEYQQFNEIIHILSEYNASSKNILDKYLKMYHIIENLMFRYPICKLEKENNGEMFSIRDFRNLYSKIDKNEINTLKEFIQRVLLLNYNSSITFNDKIWELWGTITSDRQEDINEKLLAKFELAKNDYTEITRETFKKFYHLLIYTFRNAIVHNKATEFHFTHMNIKETIYLDLIKDFLLPSLEMIVFQLITQQESSDSLIWFSNSELKLWN